MPLSMMRMRLGDPWSVLTGSYADATPPKTRVDHTRQLAAVSGTPTPEMSRLYSGNIWRSTFTASNGHVSLYWASSSEMLSFQVT